MNKPFHTKLSVVLVGESYVLEVTFVSHTIFSICCRLNHKYFVDAVFCGCESI